MEYIVYIEGENAQIEFSKESVFSTIDNDGLVGLVSSVWEADKQDGTFRDVSEDIARDFMNKYSSEYEDSDKVPEFISKQLGEEVGEYFPIRFSQSEYDDEKGRSAWENA